MKLNWNDYPDFSISSLVCKVTGECNMRPEMMDLLQSIRTEYARPMFISTGFRSKKHPIELERERPSEHTLGLAVDIICYGTTALELLKLAIERGVRRIGIHQKGELSSAKFIHLGIADKFYLSYPADIWTY